MRAQRSRCWSCFTSDRAACNGKNCAWTKNLGWDSIFEIGRILSHLLARSKAGWADDDDVASGEGALVCDGRDRGKRRSRVGESTAWLARRAFRNFFVFFFQKLLEKLLEDSPAATTQ